MQPKQRNQKQINAAYMPVAQMSLVVQTALCAVQQIEQLRQPRIMVSCCANEQIHSEMTNLSIFYLLYF